MKFFEFFRVLLAGFFKKGGGEIQSDSTEPQKYHPEGMGQLVEVNNDRKLDDGVAHEAGTAGSDDSQPPQPPTSTDFLAFFGFQHDLNEYKAFMPNSGELDPGVSTISDGREPSQTLRYLHDEFTKKYGRLTTDLGYGLIYSIVMRAVEDEKRTISSALREAIARSNDPFLCVAVVRDYCFRKEIRFQRYERIVNDIFKRREQYYKTVANSGAAIDFSGVPALPPEERQELEKSNWLFNGTILEIYPPLPGRELIYLKVRIKTLSRTEIVREFDRAQTWRLGQNVVIQVDEAEVFRILHFRKVSTNGPARKTDT